MWELNEGMVNYRRVDAFNRTIGDTNETVRKPFINVFVCFIFPFPPITSLESSIVVFTV